MGQDELSINQSLVNKLYQKEDIDKDQLRNQFISLFQYYEDLTSSLKYAEVIQQGVLPKSRHFNRVVDDFFVLYQPQSYVSGDFYWIGEIDSIVLFAVGDCTGHGVPGAMLTMLAQSFLNHIILGKKCTNTSKILKEFDKKFIETFQSENINSYSNDWIDIALCSVDKTNMKLEFAGAKRKILIVSNNTAELVKGSNYPLGGWQIEDDRLFENREIKLNKNDMIYLGSDGFQDQIGGENCKKFGSKKLHELLVKNSFFSCSKQKQILENVINEWKQGYEQLDDVCVMGIRI